MTDGDLNRIEQVIGLRLPEEYRETMKHYPFVPGSSGFDCMLYNDAKIIINTNRTPHDILRGRPPTRDYLYIGGDGGETHYYLDLRGFPHSVYAFDLEIGDLTLFADDLDDYVRKCEEIDREVEADKREDERLATEKQWWQFCADLDKFRTTYSACLCELKTFDRGDRHG